MRKKIGACLIQAGLITEEDLQTALGEHERTGERIGAALVRLNLASEAQVTKALAYQLGFPYANLADVPPELDAILLIPREVALERGCVALRREDNLLTVAMSDPLLFSLLQDLEFQTGHRIKQVVATRTDILHAIENGYPEQPPARVVEPRTAPAIDPPVPPASIVDLVDLVVSTAVASGASDVHIEPQGKGVLVRHRLDGVLGRVMDLPRQVHEGLVARVKLMAGMDIAEKRLPQDGRLRVKQDGRDVNLRVSTLGTLYGEKIVLRVLDHRKGPPPLDELGLSAAAMNQVKHLLRLQHGMILVVGPTGSGKTTTLSSAISSIKSGRTNIITIEDPIEYEIRGINQTEVNEKARLTFASALRAILRQDPDVVLVGEIRDQETARIAMQAAQTGRLVLSTLHTDDAPSTMTRLVDMGMEPYVLASALAGIIAQRLVRRLCTSCRRQYMPEADTLRALNITETDAAGITFYREVGCEECHNTGYRGRIALYEVMPVTEKVRRLVAQNAGEALVRDAAISAGMTTLGEDGLSKVKAGITTAEELLRVVTEVREMRTLCPGCSGVVAVDFMACPHCGWRLHPGCGKCGRALQAGWHFCPFCAATQGIRPERKAPPGRPPELPRPNLAEFKNAGR
ncbi:MAG TPA: ATPase, T2SS/T4P/T4SS family [Vicinamibacterales bacterium]|nr:ATPase, T2SS/T4P/T4SS family [Vicinamibacterales bacterium]